MARMPAASELGTEDEVAAHLRKSPKTLRNWRCDGVGPPYLKVGGGVLYRWREVEKWLTSQTVDPAGRTA